MLDLFQQDIADRVSNLKPVQDVEPGWFTNYFRGTGMATMRGFAEVGRAVSMAGAVVPMLGDKITGGNAITGRTELQERYFKSHDQVFNAAVDYWTPKPNEVGVAGDITGKLLSMIPLVIANPATAVGATQLSVAEDLARKHLDVTPTEANLVGAVNALGLGLGIWMPILGQNLTQRLLVGGAGFNVVQGVATRAASAGILEGKPAAKEFEAFDGKALTLDVLLGLAFGSIAHVVPSQRAQGAAAWTRLRDWAKDLKPTEIDALMVLREAQHLNADSMPGKPATEQDVAIHVDRMRSAIDSLARDQPVAVEQMNVSRESLQPDQAAGEAGRPEPTITEQAVGIVGKEEFDAAVAAHVEQMGGDTLRPEQVAEQREVVAQRIVDDAGQPTREPQFTPDPERIAAAERQIADMQAAAERVRLEEGIPRQEAQVTRPPSDITPLEPEAQARAVGQHIERKLIETGMQRDEAVANAAVWEAFAKSAHERYGITPEELMRKYGVDVKRMDSADKLLGALEQRYTQTDTPEFKNWFGDSKVVDPKGKPLVVYHSSPEKFNVFDTTKEGAHFGTLEQATNLKKVGKRKPMALFLSIQNPLRMMDIGQFNDFNGMHAQLARDDVFTASDADAVWAEWQKSDDTGWAALKRTLEGKGYDGIVYANEQEGHGDSYIAFRPEQVKSAIGNRGTFDPNNPNILFQSDTGPFYSELSRRIDDLKTGSAPAKGWKDQIKGMLSKGLVRQAEIEAVGLNEWLDIQPGKVTKQQVQDFLAQNGVRVEEVELGGEQKRGLDGADARRFDELMRRQADSLSDAEELELDALVAKSEAAIAARPPQTELPTKFAGYQLPGGENYRELLLTLPEKEAVTRKAKLEQRYADLIAEIGNNPTAPNVDALITERNRVRTALEEYGPRGHTEGRTDQVNFQSSHFDTPNILAHIRFNERTDADGKRVLFLEEIQSDWAQKGKREGFVKERPWRVLRSDGELQSFVDFSSREDAQAWIDANANGNGEPVIHPNSLMGAKGVPEAPFIGKTDAWVTLAMKRMIRYAAENGFDRVAWTTGDQQVTRYTSALRKQVDAIEWTKTKDGVQLVGYKNGPTASPTKIDRTKVVDTTEKESVLSDAIGKAMADKIRNDPAQSGVIEGADIKIDDTGMATFYDRIVPNVANDVLKKLGGGRVGKVGLSGEDGTYIVYDRNGDVWATRDRRDQAAMDASTIGGSFKPQSVGHMDQSGFDITPALRDKAMAGMPLFQGGARGAVNFDTGRTLISLFEKADKSTFQHETAHVFLEMTKDLASREGAPIAAMQDWATLANWLKVEGGAIPREAHEQFARGWEKYLAEGVAPNEKLKGAFKRFRDWLLDIYKSLVNIDAPLNNQVRGVMARMLESQAKDPVSKGGLEDPRLRDPEFRSALEVMGREAGWDQIGGSIIRERAGFEAEGEPNAGAVVGRTEWVPRAEWYGRMQQSAANMPGVGGASVRAAVGKALMGEKMSAAEKRAVTFMLDEHVQVMKQWDEMHAAEVHPEADPFEFNNAQHAAGIEPTRENTLDMVLIDRARELDAPMVEAIPDNFDDAQYMQAIREIIDAKRPNQETDQSRAGDAQAPRADDQEGRGETAGPAESVAPRPATDSAGYPPPPGGTGEAAGAAAPTNMAATEAYRIAAENPDIKVRVGTDTDGTPIYKTLNDLLDDAAADALLARDDMQLITVAAECLMGVA